MKTKICLLGIFALVTLAMAAPHTWTFTTGKTFDGDYYSSGTTAVVIRNNGTNYIFKMADLSTNDLAYVAKIQADQKQAKLDAEVKQMQQAAQMEFTSDLIENFPEKVNQQRGWMDSEFLELENIYTSGEEDANLGFAVADKNDNSFYKCVVSKYLPVPGDSTGLQHNPLVEYVTGLKRHDKIRLVGTVSAPLSSDYRRFNVERVEIIETTAEKKNREQASQQTNGIDPATGLPVNQK
jgi:hypothetical protein